MVRTHGITALFGVTLLVGCVTMTSTPINREPTGTFSKDLIKQPHGVPVRIKVPTHVDVKIVETFFLENRRGRDGSGITDFREVRLPNRNLQVMAEPVLTEQVVTVDFKRPFSGRLAYSATMTEDQYFKSIGGEIEDNTLKDVGAAVAQIVQLGTGSPTSAEKTGIDGLISDQRVVAFRRFDIDEPDYEQQMLDFVHHHLNACHHCLGSQTFAPQTLTPRSMSTPFMPGSAIPEGGPGRLIEELPSPLQYESLPVEAGF